MEGAAAGRTSLGREPVPAERPAPRDQPVAGAAADPPDPFGPLAPDLGGRSSGGAVRTLAPSASVTFRPGPGLTRR